MDHKLLWRLPKVTKTRSFSLCKAFQRGWFWVCGERQRELRCWGRAVRCLLVGLLRPGGTSTGWATRLRRATIAFSGLLAVAVAAPAAAQTATTFVSNIGVDTNAEYVQICDTIACDGIWAQQFTTGDNTDGYTLTEVLARLNGFRRSSNVEFAIHGSTSGVDSWDVPGNKVVDLNLSGSLSVGVISFSPASTTTLQANTEYFVLFKAEGYTTFHNTNSDALDSGAAAGWDIADRSVADTEVGSRFYSDPESLKIAIKGKVGNSGSIITLVSNMEQPNPGFGELIDQYNAREQQFTTGSNAAGYTLSEISVNVKNSHLMPTPAFALYCSRNQVAATIDAAGDHVVDLTGSVTPVGERGFVPVSATTLLPSTKYIAVFATTSGQVVIQTSLSSRLADGVAPGWGITGRYATAPLPLDDDTHWSFAAGGPIEIAAKGTRRSGGAINSAPSGADETVTITEGSYSIDLKVSDFSFSDCQRKVEMSPFLQS